MKGNLIYAQSGGPTSVFNATMLGAYKTALKQKNIEKAYLAKNGISGILNENFLNFTKEELKIIDKLLYTPATVLGSVRYKLKDYQEDETDYLKILEVFKKYNIRYFLYNGGNDSMDTVYKVDLYLKSKGYQCNCIGVPKTIDNDLEITDHCPGFGSAAKYVINSILEVYLDNIIYPKNKIIIFEVMGRNAGWLTASSFLLREKVNTPDLVYLPEKVFDLDNFINKVKEIYEQKGSLIICLSEGCKTKDGKYLSELNKTSTSKDSFNHVELGGAGKFLASLIKEKLNIKSRVIEFSTLQRSASHLASLTDINEAFNAGKNAVLTALNETGYMIGYKRLQIKEYKIDYIKIPLEKVINKEKMFNENWIISETEISKEFINYLKPLIKGETKVKYQDGILDYFIKK